MTEDMTDAEGTGLLRALGRVEPPAPGVLDAAREVLWSAVAQEAFSAGTADEAGRARTGGRDRPRRDTRRRRAEPGS
jgi:hypothetical protein